MIYTHNLMKIFLDTADLEEIRAANATGLIDGVTTNPTLILRSGKTLPEVAQQLVMEFPNFESISTEVVADTAEEMIAQAQQYIKMGPAITVKLPCTVEGLKACRVLNKAGIKTNVTLVMCAAQAVLAAKAGATYVSPFVGRLDDQSVAGLEVVRSISELYRIYGVETQVLSASIRSVQRIVRSWYNGAQVVTMPPKHFWEMYNHILTKDGLDRFQKDWDAANAEL
jgi:transaldolase